MGRMATRAHVRRARMRRLTTGLQPLQSLLADGRGGSAAESESELLPGSKLAEQLAQPPEHFHMHRWSWKP